MQHNVNVICLEMARSACALPGKLCASRKLADASQLLPEPSAESGKGQGQVWHQWAELLSGSTHVMARLSAAEQWGMGGAEHLVHEVL